MLRSKQQRADFHYLSSSVGFAAARPATTVAMQKRLVPFNQGGNQHLGGGGGKWTEEDVGLKIVGT